MNTPQERVREWLDEWDRWARQEPTLPFPDNIEYNGTSNLTTTDLRDVLNELDEHQRLLEQIDEALDGPSEYGNIERIRALLGNHTEDNL